MADEGSDLIHSEKIHVMHCSRCAENGRNVDSVKHCMTCGENLCAKCLTRHNELNKEHTVLDQVHRRQEQAKPQPSLKCDKHGKIIGEVCRKHDAVGCVTCIAFEHSSCNDIRKIADVATGIKTSQELKTLDSDMTTLKTRFGLLKKSKGENLQQLQQDKDSVIKQIRSTRQKLNDELDKMEKEIVKEAEDKFQRRINAVKQSIDAISSALAKIDEAKKRFLGHEAEPDVFIACKMAKHELLDEAKALYDSSKSRLTECSFQLRVDENAEAILDGKRLFATILEQVSMHRIKAEEKSIVNILTKDDKFDCHAAGICLLSDGGLVISDSKNKNIKKLDEEFKTVSTVAHLQDQPGGLCMVDHTRLAVCLFNKKKIQFITLGKPVDADDSFPVADRCRDVDYYDGLLYVCCGGNADEGEGNGRIEIYNCNGKLEHCLYDEGFCPAYISVAYDGQSKIYVSDLYEGLHVREMSGMTMQSFMHQAGNRIPFCLISPICFCAGESCGRNIYLHTLDDKKVLLKSEQLIANPSCMCYDDRSSLLIVGGENSGDIKIFVVEML